MHIIDSFFKAFLFNFLTIPGNFYWANCDHIASLPRLHTRFDPWLVEYFPLNISKSEYVRKLFGANCGYSPFTCNGVNHYDKECPRNRYRMKVYNYIKNKELPLNPVSTDGPTIVKDHIDWMRDICMKLHQKKYQDYSFFEGSNSVSRTEFPIKSSRNSLNQIEMNNTSVS